MYLNVSQCGVIAVVTDKSFIVMCEFRTLKKYMTIFGSVKRNWQRPWL